MKSGEAMLEKGKQEDQAEGNTASEKKLTDAEWYFLYHGLLWSKGVLFQGRRLLQTDSQTSQLNDLVLEEPQHSYLYAEQIKVLDDIRRYEEEFFVHALYNAWFFLSRASNTISGFKAFVERIESINGTGMIKDMRDMRAHIDEYIKGAGRFKERFCYVSPDDLYPAKPFGEHLFEADVTGTIVFPDAYIIGGRINVNKTIQVLEELLPDIIKRCDQNLCPKMNNGSSDNV